jgi:hypothetical protein
LLFLINFILKSKWEKWPLLEPKYK